MEPCARHDYYHPTRTPGLPPRVMNTRRQNHSKLGKINHPHAASTQKPDLGRRSILLPYILAKRPSHAAQAAWRETSGACVGFITTLMQLSCARACRLSMQGHDELVIATT